jgi:hypothetical protein
MQSKNEKYGHKKAICSFLIQIWTYKSLYLGVIRSKLRQNIGKIASMLGHKILQKTRCRYRHMLSFCKAQNKLLVSLLSCRQQIILQI